MICQPLRNLLFLQNNSPWWLKMVSPCYKSQATRRTAEKLVLPKSSIRLSLDGETQPCDALEPYPKVFDSLFVAMTRAGEASGRLDIILKQLVQYIEKAAKLKSQIKSALAYPAIIVLVSIIVITVLLVFVVPSLRNNLPLWQWTPRPHPDGHRSIRRSDE